MTMKPIFAVPIDDKVLIYSPLQKMSALVNRTAALMIRDSTLFGQEPHDKVSLLCEALNARPPDVPEPRTGALRDPLFLGLTPVYGGGTGCPFADCTVPVLGSSVMPLETARHALDAYFELLAQVGQHQADIRIFGGEDFPALDVLFFSEAYARRMAEKNNLDLRLTLVAEGLLPLKIAQWVGDHFDGVTLCLKGFEEIGDNETFESSIHPAVFEKARIFSESPIDLTLRVCITQQTIQHMGEIAVWLTRNLISNAVSFQAWFPPFPSDTGFDQPDPINFARAFNRAAHVLENCGILALHHPADIRTIRISSCPVGKDALIISPGGEVNACTLSSTIWQANELPFKLGAVTPDGFEMNPVALNNTRSLTLLKAPVCEDCISLFHCTGGCHVHSPRQNRSGEVSDRCQQIRLVTVSNLLRAMDQFEAARDWLDSYELPEPGCRVFKDRLKDLK